MKWIEYKIASGENRDILIDKRIGYNEVNLAIATAEAYNGEYEIINDEEEGEVKPLSPELGGTGEKSIEEFISKNKFTRFLTGSYIGTGEYAVAVEVDEVEVLEPKNRVFVDFNPKLMIIGNINSSGNMIENISIIPFAYKNGFCKMNKTKVCVANNNVYASLASCVYENGAITWYVTNTTTRYQDKANLETGFVSSNMQTYSETDQTKIDKRIAQNQLNEEGKEYVYYIFG